MTRMEVAFTSFFMAFIVPIPGMVLALLLRWLLPPEPEMDSLVLACCCSGIGFFLGAMILAGRVKDA